MQNAIVLLSEQAGHTERILVGLVGFLDVAGHAWSLFRFVRMNECF